MINPKIIRLLDINSSSPNVSEFIKRLILFEESETGSWKWKETYQREIEKHYEVGGDDY